MPGAAPGSGDVELDKTRPCPVLRRFHNCESSCAGDTGKEPLRVPWGVREAVGGNVPFGLDLEK